MPNSKNIINTVHLKLSHLGWGILCYKFTQLKIKNRETTVLANDLGEWRAVHM